MTWLRALIADFRAAIHLKAERRRTEAYGWGAQMRAEGLPESYMEPRVKRSEAVADLMDALVGWRPSGQFDPI